MVEGELRLLLACRNENNDSLKRLLKEFDSDLDLMDKAFGLNTSDILYILMYHLKYHMTPLSELDSEIIKMHNIGCHNIADALKSIQSFKLWGAVLLEHIDTMDLLHHLWILSH